MFSWIFNVIFSPTCFSSISQLMNLLDDSDKDGTQHIVSWLSNGQGFIIHNKKRFVDTVLPKYFFNDVQFTSFTRKLRRWGFRSKRVGHNLIAYSHQMFVKGDKISCLKMRPLNNERDVPSSSVRRSMVEHLQQQDQRFPPSISLLPQEEDEDTLSKMRTPTAQTRNQQIVLHYQNALLEGRPVPLLVEGNPSSAPLMTRMSSITTGAASGGIPLNVPPKTNCAYHTMSCRSSSNFPAPRILDSSDLINTSHTPRPEDLCATNNIGTSAGPAAQFSSPASLYHVAPIHQLQSSPYQYGVSPCHYYDHARESAHQRQQHYSIIHREQEPIYCPHPHVLGNFSSSTSSPRVILLLQNISPITSRLSDPVSFTATSPYYVSQQEPVFLSFDINQWWC